MICGALPLCPGFCSPAGRAGFLRGFAPVALVLQNLWFLHFILAVPARGFTGLRPGAPCFGKTFGFCVLFWKCLPEGRLGPPFFPAGKESAAGGVKKGGQGGLPMGPLDDPPTANKGGCGPLFWINSPGERTVSALESAGGAIYTGRLYCHAIAPEARAGFVSCYGGGKALRCCPW